MPASIVSTPQKLRVLIVDDELLARQRLEDLLAKKDEVELIGMATNGHEAVEAIRTQAPDLVFLDIQMPGLTGVDVVREIGPARMPATIFVTAYDQYALKAFEVAALDYLLKPFEDERFEQAFARAVQAVALRQVEGMASRMMALLQGSREETPPDGPATKQPPAYLERIAVEMRGQMRIVPIKDIDYITASGPYAELHVGEDTHVIRERMQTLEERLDPEVFFRIHRSAIVRLDRIESLLHGVGGDYAVRLKNGRRVKVSRGRREELEQRLGLIL